MVDAICQTYGWLPSDWLRRDRFLCMIDATVRINAHRWNEYDPAVTGKPRPRTVGEIREAGAAQAAAFDEMKAKLEAANRRGNGGR